MLDMSRGMGQTASHTDLGQGSLACRRNGPTSCLQNCTDLSAQCAGRKVDYVYGRFPAVSPTAGDNDVPRGNRQLSKCSSCGNREKRTQNR